MIKLFNLKRRSVVVRVLFGTLIFLSNFSAKNISLSSDVSRGVSNLFDTAAFDKDLFSEYHLIDGLAESLNNFTDDKAKNGAADQRLARVVLGKLLVLSRSEKVLRKIEIYKKFRLLAKNTLFLIGFDEDFNKKFIQELNRQRGILLIKYHIKIARRVGIFVIGSIIALGSLCGSFQKIEDTVNKIFRWEEPKKPLKDP